MIRRQIKHNNISGNGKFWNSINEIKQLFIDSYCFFNPLYYIAYLSLYPHTYAMSRSLVKLTEIGTSWGRGATVTQKSMNIWESLANSEDPDEMPQNVAFHQGFHCLLR